MILWAQASPLSESRVISTKIAEIRKKLGTYLFLICKIPSCKFVVVTGFFLNPRNFKYST